MISRPNETTEGGVVATIPQMILKFSLSFNALIFASPGSC